MSDKYKAAYDTWQEKTEWVQETAVPRELGKHRADVLRERIENLKLELADLRANPLPEYILHSENCLEDQRIVELQPDGDPVTKKAYDISTGHEKLEGGALENGHPRHQRLTDPEIARIGREMSHNLTGNGFLFLDEAQLIGFARALMARALG